MATPSTQTVNSNRSDAPVEDRSNSGSEKHEMHTLKVHDGEDAHTIQVQHGRTLRTVLFEHDLSPHGWITQHVNCQGQGHCAACTVQVQKGDPDAGQWLDAYLAKQDLGRLSCQVDVTQDLAVRVG